MRTLLIVLVLLGCLCVPAVAADCSHERNTTNSELRETLDDTIRLLTIIRDQVPEDDRQVMYYKAGHEYMMEQLCKLRAMVSRCVVVRGKK